MSTPPAQKRPREKDDVPARAKRPKSSQACASCRKHKTRCELLDDARSSASGSLRCHRCNVLGLPCSFDGAENPPVASSSKEPMSAPAHTPLSSTSAPYSRHDDASDTPHSSVPDTSSIRYKGPPCSPPSLSHDDDEINPALLLPISNLPWGFMKDPAGHDWTYTPMLAMQDLARGSNADERDVNNENSIPLASILSPDQIETLLDIFDTQYNPWLGLPSHLHADSPLVNLARCMVACRRLDTINRSVVTQQLQRLVESLIPKLVFQPEPSTESMHFMLILSLWAPVSGSPHIQSRDGRLIAGAAVSMAMNIKLSQATVYTLSLREKRNTEIGLSAEQTVELADAEAKARLWMSLSVVESMLCVGTGRFPLSHRTEQDHRAVDTNFSNGFGISSGRDTRLGLLAKLSDLTEYASRVPSPTYSNISPWYREINNILLKFDSVYRIILPTPMAEHEVFYHHMMQVYYHANRLLTLHMAIRCARNAFIKSHPAQKSGPWYHHLTADGTNVASVLGQDAISSAEAIMITTLSRPEIHLLGTSPDNLFAMISFAATFLIMVKFAVLHNQGEVLTGASDHLLIRIIERLKQAAVTPDHAAAKCAHMITALMTAWEKQASRAAQEREEAAVAASGAIDHAVSAERGAPTMEKDNRWPEVGVEPSHMHMPADGLPFTMNEDLQRYTNSDIFLDTEFWSSFMENLTSERDVPDNQL